MSFLFQPPIFGLQQQQRYNTWTPVIQQPMFVTTTPLTLVTPTMTVPVVISPPAPPPTTTILIQPVPTPPLIMSTPPARAPPSQSISMRIIFYGQQQQQPPPSEEASLFFCATDATYHSPPSRDKLLCDMACWARQHGVMQAGRRVDPAKVRLYVLPGEEGRGGGGGGARLGLTILPGVGPVMPGDVVRVVRLDQADEAELAEAMEDVRRRGYAAFWAVDVDGDGEEDADQGASSSA